MTKTNNLPKNIYQIWVWLLILSFSYERPIFLISSMDRLNPRLFDLVLSVGLFLIFFGKKSIIKAPIFISWVTLVFWFSICTTLGVILFQFTTKINLYMFFFLLGYIKGVLAIFLVLRIPNGKLSFDDFLIPLIIGGVFVSSYCIYEMFYGIDQVVLTDSVVTQKPKSMVWGPFSSTYFHLAVYVPLVSSLSFSRFLSVNRNKLVWLFITIYISWPVFFSGSRTGVALLVMGFLITLYYSRKNLKTFFSIVSLSIVALMLLSKYVFTEENYTYQRAVSMSDAHEDNSIINRILLFTDFDISEYDKSEFLPFIGAGFYVAPVSDGRFRIGYGFHNIYIFVIEQSGIIGLFLFLIFLFYCIKIHSRFLNQRANEFMKYRWAVVGIYSYFVACLIIGISGHSFWYGFNTGEFQTLRILMLVVSASYISTSKRLQPFFRRGND